MKATRYNNHWIQLEFKSDEERNLLRKAVSYEIPGAKHSASYQAGFWNGTRCFLTEANKISYGIFKSLFPDHSLVCDKDFKELTYEDIPLYRNKKWDRRDYQLSAINTIFKNKRGLIESVVGSGKTLIAAAVISKHLSDNLNNRVLFVVYDKNILAQTITNFKKYGLHVTQFGDGIKDLTGNIIVATIQSLARIQDPKTVLKNISMCIADESHHAKSKTSRDVLTKLHNCDYFIGLTGTPYKEKTLELAELTSVLGPVIFKYGFQDAVAMKNVAPVKTIFVKVPVDIDIKAKLIDRKNYKYIWDTGIKENTARHQVIANLLTGTSSVLNTTALVLVDRIEHGNSLAEYLKLNTQLKVVEMYGEDPILVREMKKEALMKEHTDVLISSVMGEGVDLPIAPVVAVNASGRKSFIKLIQFLGRIVRKNEKFKQFRVFYDLDDSGYHKYFKDHYRQRKLACEDFGTSVSEVATELEALKQTIAYYKTCMA